VAIDISAAITKALAAGRPPDWCRLDISDALDKWFVEAAARKGGAISGILGFGDKYDDLAADSLMAVITEAIWGLGYTWDPDRQLYVADEGVAGKVKAFVADFAATGSQVVLWLVSTFADTMLALAPLPDTPNAKVIRGLMGSQALVNAIAKWTGFSFPLPTSTFEQTAHWLLPTRVNDYGSAMAGFLANVIDQRDWQTLVRAAGVCQHAANNDLNTQRWRPGIEDARELWQRGNIDEAGLVSALRAQGLMERADVRTMQHLWEWWPQAGDIMQRAVLFGNGDADRAALQLDKGSDVLMTPAWRQSITRLGMDDGDAVDLWAAHWRPLDLARAFEWYRRSQSGEPGWQGAFGDDDLERAVRQSLLPPALQELALESVYTPPPRRILATLYTQGSITSDRALQAMQYEGLSPEDAQAELAVMDQAAATWRQDRAGAIKPTKLLSDYQAGLLSDTELTGALMPWGYTAAQATLAIQEQQGQRVLVLRERVTAAAKSQYLGGCIDDGGAVAILTGAGMPADGATFAVQQWAIELSGRCRQIQAAELLSWYGDGLIGESEMLARILRLGYSTDDARRLYAAWIIRQQGKGKPPAGDPLAKQFAAEQREWDKALKEAQQVVASADRAISSELAEGGKLLSWVDKIVRDDSRAILASANGLMAWVKGRITVWAHKLGLDPITLEPKGAGKAPPPAPAATAPAATTAATTAGPAPGPAPAGTSSPPSMSPGGPLPGEVRPGPAP